MKETILTLTFMIVVILLVGAGLYLKYQAYHERFPNAAPWTFFFQP